MTISFMQCPVCGSAVVITEQGLVYCPVCDPQCRLAARPCTVCRGSGEQPQVTGDTCDTCGGSGFSIYVPAPAAMREHWGYAYGMHGHGLGLGRDDSPFSRHSDADRSWRAGWAVAARWRSCELRREKLDHEFAFERTHREMCNAA